METVRFPNKLRSYRRCKAYSQKKVARMLGLSDTSVLSKWERGITVPSIVQIFRLAWLYEVLPHQLYDELWSQIEKDFSLVAHTDEPIISNQTFYV